MDIMKIFSLTVIFIFYVTEAKNSTEQILKGTGISMGKKTHLRTACLQDGGFMGLQPWQINTLTDHMTDEQFKSC